MSEAFETFCDSLADSWTPRGTKRPVTVLTIWVQERPDRRSLPASMKFGRITLKARPKNAGRDDPDVGDRVNVEVPIRVAVVGKPEARVGRSRPVTRRAASRRPEVAESPSPAAEMAEEMALEMEEIAPVALEAAPAIGRWGTKGALVQLRRPSSTRTAKGCLAARVLVTPNQGDPFTAWLTVAHNAYDGKPPPAPQRLREIRSRISSNKTIYLGSCLEGTAWCEDIYSEFSTDAALIKEAESQSASSSWIASHVDRVYPREDVEVDDRFKFVDQSGAIRSVRVLRWSKPGEVRLYLNGLGTTTHYPRCLLLRGDCEAGDSGTLVYRAVAGYIQALGLLCGKVKVSGVRCIVVLHYADARNAIKAGEAIKDFNLNPIPENLS